MQSDDMAAYIFAAPSRGSLHALYAAWRKEFNDAELIQDAERLKTEQFDLYLHNDLSKARWLALALSMLGRDVTLPYITGLGLLAQADATNQAGRSRAAMACFERAAERFLVATSSIGWARARGGWLAAASDAGAITEDDLASMADVCDVLRKAGEHFRLANVQQNLARAYRNLGEFPKALATWDEALASLGRPVTSAERNLEAMILSNQALTMLWQGDHEASFTLHIRARTLFEELNEDGNATLVDLKLSIVEQERGHLSEALRLVVKAHEDLQRRNQKNAAPHARLYHAKILLKLNRVEEAIEASNEALHEFAQQQDIHDQIEALVTHAQALARHDDRAGALRCLAEAERAAGGRAHPHAFRIALERVALLLQMGQADEARSIALDVAERSQAHDVLIHHRMALLLAAEATLLLGQLDEAQTQAQRLLASGHAILGPEASYRCELVLARVAHQRGQHREALEHYDAMAATLGSFVQELAYDRRTDFLEDKDALYLEALTGALDAKEPVKALVYLEQQRARSAWIVTSGGDADLERLRAQHRGLSASLLTPMEPGAATVARRELRTLERQITERLAARATKVQSYEALDMPALLAAIPAHRTVVVYALTPHELAIFALRDSRIEVARAPRPTEVLDRLERHIRQRRDAFALHMSDGASMPAAWEQSALSDVQSDLCGLWALLLAPLESFLPHNGGALILIPHGRLHELPLSALFDGSHYITERWTVHCLPSLQGLRPPASDNAPAQASSRTDLPSGEKPQATRPRSLLALGYASAQHDLPQVTREVERIAVLTGGIAVTGQQATGQFLRDNASVYAYLHIAAHGAVRRDIPNSSFVELADGLFHPLDVLALPLHNTHLVVLSACETGLGKSRGGDDQIGLVRAFGMAGAEAVLATLWKVNDAASRIFMELFYERLAVGATPAAALHATQLAFISGAAGGAQRHPYYWAGYQLITYRMTA